MTNKEPKNLITEEYIEDVTQYGEFIPSFDQWTTFENQKKNARRLQKCTSPNNMRNTQ